MPVQGPTTTSAGGLTSFLSLFPQPPTSAQSLLGRFAEAEARAGEALEQSPEQPRAWVNRGFARLKGQLPGVVP